VQEFGSNDASIVNEGEGGRTDDRLRAKQRKSSNAARAIGGVDNPQEDAEVR
jgi:hypothetical protein